MNKKYYVYIITNNSKTLYTGLTNNLARRLSEHKSGVIQGFSSKYKCKKLVYYEIFESIEYAIKREKQIKGWIRRKKIELIESINPEWKELNTNLY